MLLEEFVYGLSSASILLFRLIGENMCLIVSVRSILRKESEMMHSMAASCHV